MLKYLCVNYNSFLIGGGVVLLAYPDHFSSQNGYCWSKYFRSSVHIICCDGAVEDLVSLEGSDEGLIRWPAQDLLKVTHFIHSFDFCTGDAFLIIGYS